MLTLRACLTNRTAAALAGGLTVLSLLVCAGNAAAQSLDAAGTHIISFADTRPLPSAAELASEETSLRQMYCTSHTERVGTVSLSAALAAARQLVSADSHGDGLAAFSSSPAGRTESDAVAAAAGALGVGKPAAALAGLLRAHELAPSDPVPLIDAAPLMSEAGRGNEALALLTAAQRLRLPAVDAFGIGWPAVIDANRGQALMSLHQYGTAETALQAAVHAAPLLSEADQNLGVAFDCQGNGTKAQKYLVAAVTRQEFAGDDYIGKTIEDPFGELDPAEVLDTSMGEELTLEKFHYPKDVAEGHAENDFFNTYAPEQTAKYTQLSQRFESDQAALFAELDHESELTQERTSEIEQAVGQAGDEPNIASLQSDVSGTQNRLLEIIGQEEGPSGCLDHGASHATLIERLGAADAALRKYAGALYERQTALAANLADPLAHQVALDQANAGAQGNFMLLVGEWSALTSYDAVCDSSAPNPENAQSAQRVQPPSRACPSGLSGLGFTLNLLVLEFKVSCEKASVEATIGSGVLLNGFVRVEQNFAKGTVTVFGGAKAGVKVSLGPFSGGATARDGIYVTFGPDGTVQDVGARNTTSASLKLGAYGVSISGPEATFSFVGLFSGR
jgi:hypothetical protein